MVTAEATQATTLERGDIYFFYRPKIEKQDPGSAADVQRLYLVLSPRGKKRYRLLIIGSKELPEPGSGQRYWGFVTMVRTSPQAIREELSAETYHTKTRGKRQLPAARPLGEGVYQLVLHDSHTHLLYALELPKQPGEVQEEFQLEPEASYIISIKNPEKPSPPGAGLPEPQQADLPRGLREKFHGRRFLAADPPDVLDREGTEFILIAAAEDVKKELGIELDAEDESARSADIFKDLELDRKDRPTRPLFEGKWE